VTQRTINRITKVGKQKNKNMKTIEGNKLIAEFMGAKTDTYGRWYYTPRVNNLYFLGDDVKEFKYHSSWDWLMLVVEKIEAIENSDDYEVDIFGNCCQIGTLDENSAVGKTKIEAVWLAVIQFIEWFNSEQSVKESDTSKAT
jgi:hypothetical protein